MMKQLCLVVFLIASAFEVQAQEAAPCVTSADASIIVGNEECADAVCGFSLQVRSEIEGKSLNAVTLVVGDAADPIMIAPLSLGEVHQDYVDTAFYLSESLLAHFEVVSFYDGSNSCQLQGSFRGI